MDWQYTNDRTVQLRWCYPHSFHVFLAVQPARAWRCHPHAPPISMQLRQCSPHVPPGRCLTCVQRCLGGKRFSPISALLPAGALTVSHTRRDDASPASVSRPWWWARSGTAAIVQSGTAHVSIAIPASDERIEAVRRASPRSITAASFIARRFQRRQRHSTLMLLRCYPPTSLV